MNEHRDVIPPARPAPIPGLGRSLIAAIGIDRYDQWPQLRNAVSDASGALAEFARLGFADAAPALLDAGATGTAMYALVTDQLATLDANDSLVVFYAGHGGSQTHDRDGKTIKTGYLIPSDADQNKVSTWIDLESWLRRIALLPPRHILVILDACQSGIALDPVVRWRDDGAQHSASFDTLRGRTSRRIITSALDNERALDSGPVAGHSLFTGCLIEALRGGIAGQGGMTTGAELAVWLRRRVRAYPRSEQTPDFGTFEFHDHGELVIPLPPEHAQGAAPARRGVDSRADTALDAAPRAGGAGRTPDRIGATPTALLRRARRTALARLLRSEAGWLMIIVPLVIAAMIGLIVAT